tara:strand:- start:596 stop:1321 length:726 start_codon:yes stop_codon:yes gene_type:complete
MIKYTIWALVVSAIFSFEAYANTSNSVNFADTKRETLQNYNARHAQYAAHLQLTEKQYHQALTKYLQLASGKETELKPLNSFPEIQEAWLYHEQNKTLPPMLSSKINEILANQLKDYSEYLGIPVQKLREFEVFIGDHIDMQKVALDFERGMVTTSDDDPETIVITCDAQCIRDAQAASNWKQLFFWDAAISAGVAVYEPFYVHYPTYPTETSYEEWRYNNFSGAMFRRVVQMCGDVVCRK